MKRALLFLLTLILCAILISACASAKDMRILTAATSTSRNVNETAAIVREVNVPSDMIGAPDKIHIVNGQEARTLEPNTDEYRAVIEIISSRFPQKLKEAALAITWSVEGKFDGDMMRAEFSFVQLSYDTIQTVKLNCMNSSDYLWKELSFDTMVFPLSQNRGVVCVDTDQASGVIGKSFGPLEKSDEVIARLLAYVNV